MAHQIMNNYIRMFDDAPDIPSFLGRGKAEYYIWANLKDTPYTRGEIKLAKWNSLDDVKRGRGETDEEEEEGTFCDCCMKGFDEPNKFGLCQCFCSKCNEELSVCRYSCENYRDEAQDELCDLFEDI